VALAAVALTAAAALAGCGSEPASTSNSGPSRTSAPSQSSAFRQCLEKHGITPQFGGRPSGGTGAAHPRPTGSAASAFHQAVQACGGSFGGHAGPAG
jgi:hypothetical protein